MTKTKERKWKDNIESEFTEFEIGTAEEEQKKYKDKKDKNK